MTRPLFALLLTLGVAGVVGASAPDDGKDKSPKGNNKDKILGKWKITAMPAKAAKGKDDLAELEKLGMYVYMEFVKDGKMTFGVGADNQEILDLIKKTAPNQKITWDAKYKLLDKGEVEIYDLPKDLQGGLFGKKDSAKVKVKIDGDEMKMTDEDGTATLKKVKSK